jgi:hypothetical protein
MSQILISLFHIYATMHRFATHCNAPGSNPQPRALSVILSYLILSLKIPLLYGTT